MARLRVGSIYVLFGFALAAATYPAWRLWLLGFNPTFDDLLQMRCFGL